MRLRPALGLMLACAALALGEAAGAAEHKAGGGAGYLAFPTLTATIVRYSGGNGVLTVQAGLDVPDAGLRTRATQSIPRLLDAYAQSLRRYGAGLRPGAAPDVDLIGTLLQRDTDRVVGRSGARVLLGGVLIN